MFREFGRGIAFAERQYLLEQILNDKRIPRIEDEFSPSGILKAVKEMQGKGSRPHIMFTPIKRWIEMQRWTKDARIEYHNIPPRQMDAFLRIGEFELGIVSPLGDIPKEDTIIMSKDTVTWAVRKHPDHSALYAVLGKDRLYPMRYAELLTGTTVKCTIVPRGISIFKFKD